MVINWLELTQKQLKNNRIGKYIAQKENLYLVVSFLRHKPVNSKRTLKSLHEK